MSFRLLTHRLFRHGRWIFQNFCKRDIHANILDHRASKQPTAASLRKAGPKSFQPAIRNATLFRFGQQARRLFVDNVLNRVTTTYSADLRTEAAKKFLYGDSTPFFALVGVSLASGSGILTKDDELEGVCWEIREAVSRLQHKLNEEELSKTVDENFGLDNLNIGPPIAKGCAAVVYAASFKNTLDDSTHASNTNATAAETLKMNPIRHEMLSPIQHTSRFVHNFGGSVDNINFIRNDLFETSPMEDGTSGNPTHSRYLHKNSISEEDSDQSVENAQRFNTNMNVPIDIGSNPWRELSTNTENIELTANVDINTYPLALKMMFNYDIQSNAMSILRAMYKETIPARSKQFNKDADNWEKMLLEQTVSLPSHPNIVNMFGVFCDQIPNLLQSSSLYPMALPPRINPHGYGRNMSLFLVMKRYNQNLRDYLDTNIIPMRVRLLLFAQLLEAVAHMYRFGVAHRDLKSDNILIDMSDELYPALVVSDFGCCLADKYKGLLMPYTSNDIDKGGNTALMAPEIINQTAGQFSMLNYTKSDLWACGAIAYEIFGHRNPFYQSQSDESQEAISLRNITYRNEDLPPLNGDVPSIVQKLVNNILQRNPKKRLTPDIAANVMQLFLWAPTVWLQSDSKPNATEILQWLLSLTTKVLCDGRIVTGDTDAKDAFGFNIGRRTYTEYLLISSFLVRAHLERIRYALDWIHNVN